MFETQCVCQPSAAGLIFAPDDPDSAYSRELRVHFQPAAYYPAEPDIGAAADFDAHIVCVELGENGIWRQLRGAERDAAEAFLNAHHRDEMWAVAEDETVEHFTGGYRRAA
jgi:hypothetical protein